MEKKKGLALSLGIMLVICMGIFIFLRICTPEMHTFEGSEEYRESKDFGKWEEGICVYEEVEDITERSEICYDNLIFLYSIFYDDIDMDEEKYMHLAIFNTGDVYCFKSSADFFLNEYYITVGNRLMFNDSNLENMQSVIYMGQLSNRERMLLNQYGKNFDNWEYEEEYLADNLEPEFDRYTDRHRDITCLARIYYPSEKLGGYCSYCIARYEMDYLEDNNYERKIINIRTYDNGALAAMDLIESGGFYNAWMDICVGNYGEILLEELEEPNPIYNYDSWIINPIE